MDNFDYKKYVSSGRIYKDVSKDDKLISESENISEKKKKEGYDAREDESLGMRTGKESTKKQSMKDRRDESYGKWGKRPNQKINK